MTIEEILNAHKTTMLMVEAGYSYPPTVAENMYDVLKQLHDVYLLNNKKD